MRGAFRQHMVYLSGIKERSFNKSDERLRSMSHQKILNHSSISPSIFHSRRNLGESFELPGLGSVACDAGNGICRLVDRISTTCKANDGICMFQPEQYAVGDLGGVRRSLCSHRLADLPFPNEPSRVQEEPRCTLGLSVKIRRFQVLIRTSGTGHQEARYPLRFLLKPRAFRPRSAHSSRINAYAFA